MKRILAGIAMVAIVAMVAFVVTVFAEEPQINPIRIATPQINCYGTYPIQIQGTNMTASAAQLNNAATVAGDGTVAATLLTGNIAAGRVTNLVSVTVQAYDADLTTLASKSYTFVTLTNVVYNNGATTGNLNVVVWSN